MNTEIEQAYWAAAQQFMGLPPGGINKETKTIARSWRYFLEINSACNLHCVTCTKGNKDGYDHLNGIMDWDLMLKCLDKIRNENQNAIVFLYGNSEPFLHPKLPEVIREVKARGLRCELSTNLNFIRRESEVLEAKPDFIIISLSGFTQEIYQRGHCGGDINKVKNHMQLLSLANSKVKVPISINFHVYNYNGHELNPMREYADSLGFGLFTSFARVISMENAIQICREDDPEHTEFEVQDKDWNKLLPKVTPQFRAITKELKIPPQEARKLYEQHPIHKVCPVGDMFTFIRHTGEASLCACVADRRITIGNYLSTNQEELSEKRRGHSICQQCLKYRMNLYFHIVDWPKDQTP